MKTPPDSVLNLRLFAALSEGQRLRQTAELTPLQPKEPHFDVDLSVACATTGLELGLVPVEVEVIPLIGGAPVLQQDWTDRYGF